MNEHERYMTDFMKVYEVLDRWGPGSETETLKAFSLLPTTPKKILDIGCGKGAATTVLAKNTTAIITAVDNEQSALTALSSRLENDEVSSRVTTVCASMTELDFDEASFDLIWSEGSAYIMGVINALTQWKPLLKKNGFLVMSDLVWLTDSPSEETAEFWHKEYPDIQTVSTRIAQMKKAGYEVTNHFTLSRDAFENYYEPLRVRIDILMPNMQDSEALREINKEIDIFDKYFGEYGYEMFILKSKV